MAMVFWTYGKMYTPSEVVSVIQDAPAYSAGVRAGDIITAVDGQKTESFEKVRQVLAIAGIKAVEIEVLRGSKSQVLLVTPEIKVVNDSAGNKVEMPFIGIASGKHEVRELNMIQALGESVYESYSLTVSMLQGLQQVVTGQRGFEQMGGPIKIAQYSGESAKNGVLSFLWFIVIISLNLAIMNLLPLPMLDGGHLLYYIIELITGKKVSSNFQMVAAKISIALLLFLMIMITYYDIIGIINR
jgi:regulator of sigma E protease